MKKLFDESLWRHFCAFGVALLIGIVVGCGGGGSNDQSSANSGSGGSSGTSTSSGASSSNSGGSSKSGSAGKNERPNIDGIPLDVYFDSPLKTADDQRLVGGGPAPAVGGGGEVAPTAGTPAGDSPAAEPAPAAKPAAAAAGSVAWNDLITAEQLDDSAKSILNELRSRLTNVGAYNRSYLEIPVFSSTLGLLAEVAIRHPTDVSWKPNAKFVRVLTKTMAEITGGAQAKGPKSYEDVNNAFLTVSEIFNGNSPAALPDAEDEIDLADAADFGYLMKQLERSSAWLQTETGTEDGLKSKAEIAARTVAVVAVISQAFRAEGYGYAEDGDFLKLADGMRDAAVGMGKAIGSDFSGFDTLRSKVSQQCTACHSVYRNG